jgi:hypothetical protein
VTVHNAGDATLPFGNPPPACVDVLGTVEISGNVPDTGDLAPIRSIGAGLLVDGDVGNLDGLVNVETIGSNATFSDVDLLSILDMPALTHVGGTLTIGGPGVPDTNNALDIIEMNALTSIDAGLRIQRNSGLDEIHLAGLTDVFGGITVSTNGEVTVLGFDSLTDVVGDFTFSGNTALCTDDVADLFARVTTVGFESQSGGDTTCP